MGGLTGRAARWNSHRADEAESLTDVSGYRSGRTLLAEGAGRGWSRFACDHGVIADKMRFAQRGSVVSRLGRGVEPAVDGGENEKGEDRAGDEAADHDGGERSLHLGPRAAGDGHRDEAEGAATGGHEDGPEAVLRSIDDGGDHVVPVRTKMADMFDEDDAVHHSDPEQGDEADAGRDRERHVAEPEGEDAARRGDGDVQVDEERQFDRVKRHIEQREDQKESDRDGDHQAVAGFLEVFELAAPGERVAGGKFDLFVNDLLGVGDKAAEVASADVALDEQAAAMFSP